MKLWKISSKQYLGYDTYDSAVVAAETEEDARNTHPLDEVLWLVDGWYSINGTESYYSPLAGDMWLLPQNVVVEYLGDTDHDIRGVIVARFNVG